MTKELIIITLLLLVIYLYYQRQKPNWLGNNSDSENTIQDLQTQLQQAHQLQTYNTQQLTNYENQVNRLQTQLTNLQKEGD
jgi:peptidoglycan hydrolase CwlO-like protein